MYNHQLPRDNYEHSEDINPESVAFPYAFSETVTIQTSYDTTNGHRWEFEGGTVWGNREIELIIFPKEMARWEIQYEAETARLKLLKAEMESHERGEANSERNSEQRSVREIR